VVKAPGNERFGLWLAWHHGGKSAHWVLAVVYVKGCGN
jgi:hypothetical protein